MPSRSRYRESLRSAAPSPAPARGSTSSAPRATGRSVYVLGAGVDVSYGIPMVNDLLRELARFATCDGSDISAAVKRRLPRVGFRFDKYAGDRAQTFLTDVLTHGSDLVDSLMSAADKMVADVEMRAAGMGVKRLLRIAAENVFEGDEAVELARLAGADGEVPTMDVVLDPRPATLGTNLNTVMQRAFQRAQLESDRFTDSERDAFELFIASTTNIEDLLSDQFAKFLNGKLGDQKNYLYLAWMLWAFLQFKSAGRMTKAGSLYERLPSLAHSVITFNYTNFFDTQTVKSVLYFHGRLATYLACDNRQTHAPPKLRSLHDPADILKFLDSLRMDLNDYPRIDIPAIVPPVTFKPLMSRSQLRTWAKCDDLLQSAGRIVVVGYSFAPADEHFNDLIRQLPANARVLVVNPSEVAARNAGRVLAVGDDALRDGSCGNLPVRRSKRLTWLTAYADDLQADLVEEAFGP